MKKFLIKFFILTAISFVLSGCSEILPFNNAPSDISSNTKDAFSNTDDTSEWLPAFFATPASTYNDGSADEQNSARSAALLELYAEYLKKNYDADSCAFNAVSFGPLYAPMFYIYDVNQDSYPDLIIQGYLGLRSKSFTEISFGTEDYFESGYYDGIPIYLSGNRVWFYDTDYTMEADCEHLYSYDDLVSFDAYGNMEKLSCARTESLLNEDGESLLSEEYYVHDQAVSKDEFNASNPDFWSDYIVVEPYEITDENINKYVLNR